MSSTGSYNIWYTWNTTSSSTSTWSSWNSTYDTSTDTSTTASYVWTTWVYNEQSKCYGESREIPEQVYNQISQPEIDRRKRLRKERLQKEKEAEQKAQELLLDLIGEDQLKIYNETGRLFVKGNKYDYIVQKSGFIKRIEKDKITDLCVHLDNRYKYPTTDNVIAMKLALEIEEDLILEKANNHGSSKRPVELPKAACM